MTENQNKIDKAYSISKTAKIFRDNIKPFNTKPHIKYFIARELCVVMSLIH